MKHVIEVFNRQTEELLLSVEVPNTHHEDLVKLMDWQTPEDEFDGYDLSPEQVRTLEVWTDKILGDPNHTVQLVCVD
ncbi:DUF7683 domain-containing protein [Pseudomonas violetae]|jgi:hypothetical protein|uniref:DUF7683 domain-containing protein n=1 Tax=Pseudomonas violetae TaxID=2915813 RepID=A0ABT0F5N9_9PSED|nr:hypothetical protein [Pseudomonas violetae]MCK1792972.1 hypothetical protein [Pseudomonas violetae]